MLSALLLLALQAVDVDDEPADLRLQVSAIGGVSVFDVDPNIAGASNRGFLTGARIGLHATRPPIARNGARLGLLPTLVLHHDFAAQRTEWAGEMAITTTFWRVTLITGVGYGLWTMNGNEPRSLISVHIGIGTRIGPLWLSVGLDAIFRVTSPGRTLAIVSSIGFEFDLQRELISDARR